MRLAVRSCIGRIRAHTSFSSLALADASVARTLVFRGSGALSGWSRRVGPSGRDWLAGSQPVAAHRFGERGQIGRTARGGGEDLGDVSEVAGSKHAGGGDREELRVDAATILEPVDLAAPDADRFAGAELTHLAVDRPGADALEAVDGLLERVVAVRDGHLRLRGYRALEHGDAAAGVVGVDEEVDRDRTDVDGYCGWRVH